ncbi:hypothetical protein H0H93_012003 [Arthromyces matolae]|nr:hypothetical protein H0H93_012003 [Arthromyces matolae]
MPKGKKGANKKGEGKKHKGRPTTFQGSKLAFLESREQQFLAAFDAGGDTSGNFYALMARHLLIRWGINVSWKLETPLLREPSDTEVNQWVVPDEEATAFAEKFQWLKRQLGNFYRHRFCHSNEDNTLTQNILEALHKISATKPRKQSALSLYSDRYYDSKIKDEFNKEWDAVKDTVPKHMRLSMSQAFVQSCFDKETPEFRESLETETQAAYKKEMAVYEKGFSSREARTPEEYEEALKNAGTYLYPVVNAIASHLGMYASILTTELLLTREIAKEECRSRKSGHTGINLDGLTAMATNGVEESPSIDDETVKLLSNMDPSLLSATEVKLLSDARMRVSTTCTGTSAPPSAPAGTSTVPSPPTAATVASPRATTTGQSTPPLAPSPTAPPSLDVTTSTGQSSPPLAPSPTAPPTLDVTTSTGQSSPPSATSTGQSSPPLATSTGQSSPLSATSTGQSSPPSATSTSLSSPPMEMTTSAGQSSPPNPPSAPLVPAPPTLMGTTSTGQSSPPSDMTTPTGQSSPPLAPSPTAPPTPMVTTSTGQPCPQSAPLPAATTSSPPAPTLTTPMDLPTRPKPRPVMLKKPVEPVFNFDGALRTQEESGVTLGAGYDLISLVPVDNQPMIAALTYLTEKPWGVEWKECVKALVDFERAREFPREEGRLPGKGRPEEFSNWMSKTRRWDDVETNDKFVTSWWTWWNSLKDLVELNRSKVEKGGSNGLMLVVLGLAWWGARIGIEGQSIRGTGSWSSAVCDVKATLELLQIENEEEGEGADDEEEVEATAGDK